MSRASKALAPRLRLIPSIVNADLPEHEERSVLGPYLPRGEVTLLAGHGGSGKTTLAASWAVTVSAGLPWAGAQTDAGRVLFASFEDPAPRVRSLLKRACRAAGVPYSAAEGVDLIDGTEVADGALWAGDEGRKALATPAAGELRAAILAGRYELVVVDNASETFNANENVRADVRGFVRWLRQIGRDADCAVLLLAHVNAQTARNGGNGHAFSGSTAWHNSVRSRLAIIDGYRLAHEKRQFGPPVEDLQLRFDAAGILVPTGTIAEKRQTEQKPISEEDAEAQRRQIEADHEALILGAIGKAAAAGDWFSAGRNGPRNPYTMGKKYGLTLLPQEAWTAVDRLVADGRLSVEEVPVKGDLQRRLKLVAESPESPE